MAAAVAIALGAAGLVAGLRSQGDDTQIHTGGSAALRPGPGEAPPHAYFDLGGQTPIAFPDSRLGAAFLSLDEPLQRAIAVLGTPTSTGPDISGTAYTWALQGGAQFTVSAWEDGVARISGLLAQVPQGSPVRVGAFGGVVVGESTLRDVVGAWGTSYTAATSPFEDFVVSYVECVGPYPVVIKFDQATATGERFAPEPTSPLWAEPVTSLLVAYADEPPGSAAGCPAP